MSGPPATNSTQSVGYSKVKLITNAFETTLPNRAYNLYDVSFTPEEKVRNKRVQLIHHLYTEVAPLIFSPRPVYDGNALMYSRGKIPLSNSDTGTFTVMLGTTSPTHGSKGSYKIRLTLTTSDEIDPRNVKDWGRRDDKFELTQKAGLAINLMQLIVRQRGNQHPNNGRAYYPKPSGQNKTEMLRIPNSGLEFRRGIFQSIRPALGRMILTVDTSTAVLYEEGPMLDICMRILGLRNVNDLDLRPEQPAFRRLDMFFKKNPGKC